jgi:hypothetical protein
MSVELRKALFEVALFGGNPIGQHCPDLFM